VLKCSVYVGHIGQVADLRIDLAFQTVARSSVDVAKSSKAAVTAEAREEGVVASLRR